MKSLVDFVAELLSEIGSKCAAPVTRDVSTLRARVEHEGDSFITITLPDFCKEFERSLDEGRIAPTAFLHFKRKKGSEWPAFLSGILRNVFDVEGNLLATPSIDCIRAVRQICLFCKKVSRACSENRVKNAIESYANCDCEVADIVPENQLSRYFGRVADILIDQLDLDIASEDLLSDLRPKHGPGTTREGATPNGKWLFSSWPDRLSKAGFTYLRFGRGSQSVSDWEFDPDVWPVSLDPRCEQPSKVVIVPKTLKTPRVIAIEPVVMQYAQQAISKLLVDRIESASPTRGRVNFRDQSINQFHAYIGSKCGLLATLDLSEASDRVSLAAVQRLFKKAPALLELIEASRSSRAELPTGEILNLSKFASMGSALCFPVEALVFFTLIVASRIFRAGAFPSPRTVDIYSRNVYVYGDDLIVPSDVAAQVCSDLESFGLKVNSKKSFWSGSFRESCGTDYYDGELVTPVYLRRDMPANRSDSSGVLSAVATYHQLIERGYVRTAALIRKSVEETVGKLPVVPVSSPAIGWHDYSEVVPKTRWNKHLQRLEMRVLVPVTSRRPDPIEGDAALAKCYTVIGNPDISVSHLLESQGAYALALRHRWVPTL